MMTTRIKMLGQIKKKFKKKRGIMMSTLSTKEIGENLVKVRQVPKGEASISTQD